jgi:uncharacterized protein (DUF2236 family)
VRLSHRVQLAGAARQTLNLRIRNAVGLTQDPPPICNDPDLAYFPIDGVARLVHGDLATMIIGGLGSLFLQMLHPHAMAGVAQHSRYQHDATGRLLQTANFIGHTTYGTKNAAYLDIERVRAVHETVRGIADDGEPYYANDPHLLAWVHVCESLMFLDAYRTFGTVALSASDLDAYVMEMAQLARDLGVIEVPETYQQLRQQLDSFRPELRLSDDGVVARDFVIRGFVSTSIQRFAHRRFVASSFLLMPTWARDLLGESLPGPYDRLLGPITTRALAHATRFFVPPTVVHPNKGTVTGSNAPVEP